jgi:predicted amidohydrolase YtcJ
MKPYLLSLGAGLLVGAIYGLLNVRSPASLDAVMIDGKGHRLVPGLIDSHIRVIRGGLNYMFLQVCRSRRRLSRRPP